MRLRFFDVPLVAAAMAIGGSGCPRETETGTDSGRDGSSECVAPTIDHCVDDYLTCDAEVPVGSAFYRRCEGGQVRRCTCDDADGDGEVDCGECITPTTPATAMCPAANSTEAAVFAEGGTCSSRDPSERPEGDGEGNDCVDDRGETVKALCYDSDDCYGDFADARAYQAIPGSSEVVYSALDDRHWALCDDADAQASEAGYRRCRCSPVDPLDQESTSLAAAPGNVLQGPVARFDVARLTRSVTSAEVHVTPNEDLTISTSGGRTQACFGNRGCVSLPASGGNGTARLRFLAGHTLTIRFDADSPVRFEISSPGGFDVNNGWVGARVYRFGWNCRTNSVDLDARWGPLPVPGWVVAGAIPQGVRTAACGGGGGGGSGGGSVSHQNVRSGVNAWFQPITGWRLQSTSLEVVLNGQELRSLIPATVGGKRVELRTNDRDWRVLGRMTFHGALSNPTFRSATFDLLSSTLWVDNRLRLRKFDIWNHAAGKLRLSINYAVAGSGYPASVFELRSDGTVALVAEGPGFHGLVNPQLQLALGLVLPALRQYDGVVPGFSLQRALGFTPR